MNTCEFNYEKKGYHGKICHEQCKIWDQIQKGLGRCVLRDDYIEEIAQQKEIFKRETREYAN